MPLPCARLLSKQKIPTSPPTDSRKLSQDVNVLGEAILLAKDVFLCSMQAKVIFQKLEASVVYGNYYVNVMYLFI